ncbi:MAG: TIGR03960 family B12-binding radical SAM protein [Candidatus Omnitrophota bacterium]
MKDINEILQNVQKPARYTGGELNSVRKSFNDDTVKLVLAYPDMYEIGMSYLGLKIIYHLLNEKDKVLCERVFMPGSDMTEELIKRKRKLFSLESRKDICDFDIVGFSLSYELTYTNVLSMLDLGGIAVRSVERKEEEPLVIAGGVCSYNPEPMSAFIDAFLIGDAEDLFPEFIEKYRVFKGEGLFRKEILRKLARLKGVYVPRFYGVQEKDQKALIPFPLYPDIPAVVESAKVIDLDNAFYPVKQIVPYIRIIHDRIAVEVMRGCPNRCRFCQAGAVNRPVRIRSEKKIRQICVESYRHTGMEDIALLSLSSVNYPHLARVAKGINDDLKGKGVGLSIPSLRVDEAFYELPEIMSVIRKAGLTFAPESADENVIRSIAKDIDRDVLLRSVKIAFEKGWRSVKLYFMIGFPTRSENEADKILELARTVSLLKGPKPKNAAEVRVSVNPFIPKAHTAFQWRGMEDRRELERKRETLLSRSGKKIKISFHNIDQSLLEGVLARGDRGISEVIYTAWTNGAKMDGWLEFFDFRLWEEAFKVNNMDIGELASRSFDLEDKLPWGHIDSGMSIDTLKKEFTESFR